MLLNFHLALQFASFFGRNLGSPDVKQDGRRNELSKLK